MALIIRNFVKYSERSALLAHLLYTKGQLISKCPFSVIVWTKIPTKFFPGFLPWPLKRRQIKKGVEESQNKILQLEV